MKKELLKIFQVAVVFIGTIVGAGLASGKEISNFFTSFGPKSFIGIFICGALYIVMGIIISKISLLYKLNSYSEVIQVISPNIFGKLTGIITTLYFISSASIILAGSGALIHQFFGIPKIIGTLIMLCISLFFLLRGTEGLIEVNSFIVPGLILTISLITTLYIAFGNDVMTIDNIIHAPAKKSGVFISTLLYSGYNILCSSGVLVPLSTKMKKSKTMIIGIVLGALGLTFLSLAINSLLLINQPYIYEYEIPLLFIAQRFGPIVQAILSMIILLEMFSTEVSDVYSIGKTLEQTFKIKFNLGIVIVLAIALPISQIGFGALISTLYPMFGCLSLIFITQCIIFYFKHRKEMTN